MDQQALNTVLSSIAALTGAVATVAGIWLEQIERRKPYQSYIETTFGIQKRMADWHFRKARTFPELAAAHDTWREDYNAQRH